MKTIDLQKIEGGWRIKTTFDGQYYVDILSMLFNYRIALTPVAAPLTIMAHWCYAGKSEAIFTKTVLAALVWDYPSELEPLGWNKNGQTGEWREPV